MLKRLEFDPQWFLMALFFLIGLFIGALSLFLYFFNGNNLITVEKIHPNRYRYQFINPLLAIDIAEKKEILENKMIGGNIEKFISDSKKSGGITNASVYYRDIEPGKWAVANENFLFSPGKFIKLAIMMAYFKNAESNPEVLNQKVIFLGSVAPSALVKNKSYTVDELIRFMVNKDDDPATELLFDTIDTRFLNDVYSDLGIPFIEDKFTTDFLSLKQYSLLFRVLYNATYLNREYSEKAFEVLSQNLDPDGFTRGVGKGIPIVHRYRIRNISLNNQTGYESHTCGMVYYPDHPYLLCIMAIGFNSSKINSFFETISSFIYKQTETQHSGTGN